MKIISLICSKCQVYDEILNSYRVLSIEYRVKKKKKAREKEDGKTKAINVLFFIWLPRESLD